MSRPQRLSLILLQIASQGISEPDYIETQAQILRSGGVGVAVVRALRLDRSPVIVKKTWLESGIDFLQINALLKSLRRHGDVNAAVDSTHLALAEMRALEYVNTHLVVTPVRNSRVIEVVFKCSEPELASQIHSLSDLLQVAILINTTQ